MVKESIQDKTEILKNLESAAVECTEMCEKKKNLTHIHTIP